MWGLGHNSCAVRNPHIPFGPQKTCPSVAMGISFNTLVDNICGCSSILYKMVWVKAYSWPSKLTDYQLWNKNSTDFCWKKYLCITRPTQFKFMLCCSKVNCMCLYTQLYIYRYIQTYIYISIYIHIYISIYVYFF